MKIKCPNMLPKIEEKFLDIHRDYPLKTFKCNEIPELKCDNNGKGGLFGGVFIFALEFSIIYLTLSE